MGVLSECSPKEVLKYFEEICSIPHGSQNIDRISNYLVDFAAEHNLHCRQDETKNVIIWKAGTEGYENSAPVIIQGHMDMVAVKEEGCRKDMRTEGLDVEVNGDYISAKGTSLGGDDGIAVAYGLALLDSDTIPHPPLEVVVTVNEEIGMLGADALDTSDLRGRIMLNADSEEEGTFIVSCAGGLSASMEIPCASQVCEGTVLSVRLTGLLGGHSGTGINKGRVNAICTMGRLLRSISNFDIRLVSLSGGDADNAIAKECTAKVLVMNPEITEVKDHLQETWDLLKAEYRTVDPDLCVMAGAETGQKIRCFDAASTQNVIRTLLCHPNGIQRMNPDMEGMVQTSLNIGIAKTGENSVTLVSALRSAVESEKAFLLERVKACAEMAGAVVTAEGTYPGWDYRPDSRLRDVMVEVYTEQYGQAPVVEGIHAGLECGIFSSKLPGLDAVAFGPQIDDIHTYHEKMSISSVQRTWELIKETLKRLK